ncbi:MAG TPA: hypothetical protein VFB02_00780 [Bradyrhizobium sp.]|nr:hypothetical protein [Bradyrhizobium sp.]
MRSGYFFKACRVAAVCAAMSCSGSRAAETKTLTCSGELWNIRTDPAGTSWLEIGHGISQCSIRNTSSENAKKILSVCNLNADCSLKAEVDTQRLQKSAADGECDDACIFEGDRIVWVKKGKAQVASAGEKLPYGSQGGTDLTVVSKAGLDTEHAVIRGAITRDDARGYCEAHNGKVTKGCLAEMARYAQTLKSEIQANCTTKEFTDFFGNRYAFLGVNPERDKDDGESHARYLLKDLATGDISTGNNSSGYFTNSALFSALCPRTAPTDW